MDIIMDNEIYYVKSLQLESELELAHAKIRELRKEIQELKTKVSLLEK
jgi:hypothetical protein